MPTSEAQERRRGRDLKRRYGMTMAAYVALWTAQGGSCAVCLEPADDATLVVDHDHQSGHVRGLLCHHCNKSLGLLGHDPDRLRRAAGYLEECQGV